MISAVILAATLLALALLWWFGGRGERWAVAAVGVYLVAVPMVAPIEIQNWRVGVAGAETVLFLVFWFLAERTNRWWLTAAAGFQLISVLTFVVSAFGGDYLVLTGFAARMAAWVLVTFTFVFGAWEAWAAERLKKMESSHG